MKQTKKMDIPIPTSEINLHRVLDVITTSRTLEKNGKMFTVKKLNIITQDYKGNISNTEIVLFLENGHD